MKLVVGTFVTADGVMQAPGGPEEDPESGFSLGGWSVNYWDDKMGAYMDAWIKQLDALLLGRRTYEIFAGHWPKITDPADPVAEAFNRVPKHVASRTLEHADWKNSTVIKDVPSAVREIKKQPGAELQVHGSGNLIQTLLKHDLVDEFRIWTFPLIVGPGKRLFEDGAIPAALKLIGTMTSSTGVVINHYERAGKVETGSFALAE